jgi:cellulose synthase/poly-beta-1,6-N-acetylglucosamine synthase-like glycosyltransferase
MSLRVLALVALVVLNLALVPHFLFLLVTSLAAILAPKRTKPADQPRSRFLIVIPAHDEEPGIGAAVASCLAAQYPRELVDVLVIADNCSDRTAALAAEAGARVVERFDAVKKSKGYAIEFLIQGLVRSGEFAALDALVVIDADTTIDPDLLRYFDRELCQGHDWVQCYYTVANPDASWRTRLLTYAFGLFNGVMLLGQTALGQSAGLRGNGMCLSTRGLLRRPWESYGLVEDMEFSWALRAAGEFIAFEPDVRVRGAMLEAGGQAAANQRRRWEFGRAEIRRKYLGPLLRSPGLGWRGKLASACELTLPSMGTLFLFYVIVVGLDVLAWAAPIVPDSSVLRWAFLCVGLFFTASLGLYAVSPFWAIRLPLGYAASLAAFPFYVGWKLLVSLGGRPTAWVRTTRPGSRGRAG